MLKLCGMEHWMGVIKITQENLIIVNKQTKRVLGYLVGKTTAPNGDKYLVYKKPFTAIPLTLKIDSKNETKYEVCIEVSK